MQCKNGAEKEGRRSQTMFVYAGVMNLSALRWKINGSGLLQFSNGIERGLACDPENLVTCQENNSANHIRTSTNKT
jgi:hypothetical protein